jgi:serine/threonine protein kinase
MLGAAFLVLLGRWWRRRRRRRRLGTGMITAYSSVSKKNLWTSKRALSLAARYSGPTESCREFAYEELMQSTDGFAAESLVADGGFGTVFLGTLRDGRKVAIKRLFRDNKRRLEHFYNEIRILSSLDHPNLVKLYGFCCYHEQMDLMLVYEYAGNGSLADHLHGEKKKKKKKPPLPWGLRLRIAHETSQALCYLHNSVSPPIYHRDVKTPNILIDEGFHVKLADFGLSRFVPIDVTHVSTVPQGTPGYVDPEYHQCYQLTEKSDVYSFGVVLMELVSGKEAVDATRGKGQVNLSKWAMARIVSKSWDELIDPRLHDHDRYPSMDRSVEKSIKCVGELAFMCLQPEKDDRPSMHHVVQVLARLCDELDFDDHDYGYDPKSSTAGRGFL